MNIQEKHTEQQVDLILSYCDDYYALNIHNQNLKW